MKKKQNIEKNFFFLLFEIKSKIFICNFFLQKYNLFI